MKKKTRMMENNAPAAGSPGAEDIARINASIRRQFEDARSILIVSHVRPDGDAVGSLLGLGLALEQAGKSVRMTLADGVPHNLRHLAGSARVHRSAGDLAQADLVVVLDCSDLPRTGGVLGIRVPDVNIDHHITNLNFAHTNLVLGSQVATCAIVAEYLNSWGLSYNKDIAAALLTGIVTDTIGFRTSNVTPEALRLSAMLMEHGAELPELYTRALVSKTYEAARYWGLGLGRLQQEDVISPAATASEEPSEPNRIVWTTLTLADRQAAQYPGNDDADLVNQLSAIDGDIAVIFVEQKNGRVKVSWRSRPGIDVSQIALQFGGGGHAAAAGAEISGTLEEIQHNVLEATRKVLSGADLSRNGKETNPG
jgi:phosphoesterase RecJ-like protein